MMISLDKDIEDCLYALKLCFTRVATRSSIQEKGQCRMHYFSSRMRSEGMLWPTAVG